MVSEPLAAPGQVSDFERGLQADTLDMLKAWTSGEWGLESSRNFANYCLWLHGQLTSAPG